MSTSPSGKYKLEVTNTPTKPGCWDYTCGVITRASDGVQIAKIDRNYSSFDATWIEDHPNGHSYFVGGEDYQGQTVIELDTGKRIDHLSEGADKGFGYCWVDPEFNRSSFILVVSGCIWAGPYEFRFYDFSDPMHGWPEISTEAAPDGAVWCDKRRPEFDPDGTIRCFQTHDSDDDDDDEKGNDQVATELAAILTFRRVGLKLEFLSEWTSDAEKVRRREREEGRLKYAQWEKDFKAGDLLYLEYVKQLKDFEKVLDSNHCVQGYESHGITHDTWCPDFKLQEKRWCRRICSVKRDEEGVLDSKRGHTIDLEWAVDTGPIKLEIFKHGKKLETKFWPHSIAGMQKAFEHARKAVS